MLWLYIVLLAVVNEVISTAPGINADLNGNVLREQTELQAKLYLYRFGYMTPPKEMKEGKSIIPSKVDLQNALTRFQKKFLYYQSGVVDVPTQAKMDEYRCANKDMYQGMELTDLPRNELWSKKTLTWNVTSYPDTLSPSETREACDEAFEKWRKASGFDFIEVNDASKADVVITFEDMKDPLQIIIGTSSRPMKSRIVMDKDRPYGYRNHIPQGVSLFHALLHEIGHTLGLRHSFYRGSIMFPIVKPALLPFGTLDDVPNIDKIAIRKMYGHAQITDDLGVLHPDQDTPTHCPKYIDSVTAVTDSEWMLFRGDKVYHLNNKRFTDKGRKIQSVFPKGPEFVNATVSTGGLTFLFTERTIYAYEYDGVQFSEAPDFPRELHERVLFYPQGAFPLNNGSVILLSGNVFATYKVMDNAPSFLNDKNRYFPNLPEDFRSGIPKDIRTLESFWMFDESTVSDYDFINKQTTQVQAIPDFLKCN